MATIGVAEAMADDKCFLMGLEYMDANLVFTGKFLTDLDLGACALEVNKYMIKPKLNIF